MIKHSKKWSKQVTEHSDALNLEEGVFTWKDPKKIAKSLRISAEESTRKKASAHQAAMSMLNFYINRAGDKLHKKQKDILERAKDELKKINEKS